MKIPIITRETIQVDVTDEVIGFAYKLGTVLSALIGIWAVSCLVAGVISVGPLQLVRGYIIAVTGF